MRPVCGFVVRFRRDVGMPSRDASINVLFPVALAQRRIINSQINVAARSIGA